MSDHIPDATKMIGDTPRMDVALRKAQEDCTESYLLTEGMKLERELNAANDRIPLLIAERDTARRQADQQYKLREEFTELLGTDDVEQGVAVVREMKERIKQLEDSVSYWNDRYNDLNHKVQNRDNY
jgi:hypothetical protein